MLCKKLGGVHLGIMVIYMDGSSSFVSMSLSVSWEIMEIFFTHFEYSFWCCRILCLEVCVWVGARFEYDMTMGTVYFYIFLVPVFYHLLFSLSPLNFGWCYYYFLFLCSDLALSMFLGGEWDILFFELFNTIDSFQSASYYNACSVLNDTSKVVFSVHGSNNSPIWLQNCQRTVMAFLYALERIQFR